MSKVLILLNAGPEDPSRVESAFGLTNVLATSPDIEHVALIFFAHAVELLTHEIYTEKATSFIEKGALVLACQAHAEKRHIDDTLRAGSVPLKYVGQDIVSLVKDGYQVISF